MWYALQLISTQMRQICLCLTKYNKQFMLHFLTKAPDHIGTSQCWNVHGPVSVSDKMSYHKTSQNIYATILFCTISLKLDRHPDNSAADVLDKFRSDAMI